MTYDRNYFRMLSDSDLIARAMQSDNDLALVLGERLDVDGVIIHAQDSRLTDLEAHITTLETEIEFLKSTLRALAMPDEDDLTVFDDPEDAFKDEPRKRGSYTDDDERW